MHLAKLKIYGFKSFAQKVEIAFPPSGIVSVVGPNGCGKSNLADAIRWVMGEQKQSQMRSRAQRDLIFAGTADLSAYNQAEVSLLLDNSDGALPSQYSEVQLTRRLVRHGTGADEKIDSYYLLNGQECNLRDFRNLLKDSGMGATSYSIMTQEMMNQLLRGNQDERRRLFEEAAGIAKYKQQRRETENNLSRILADLSVVQAKLEERRRAWSLQEKRMAKAKQARELQGKVKELDVSIAADRYRRMSAKLEALREKHDRLQNDIDELTIRRDTEDIRVNEMKLAGTEDERAYRDQQAVVNEAALKITELEGRLNAVNVSIRSLEQSRADRERELAEIAGEIENLDAQIGGKDARLEELARAVGEAEEGLSRAEERRQGARDRLDEAREAESEILQRGAEIANRLSGADTRVSMLERQIEEAAAGEGERARNLENLREEQNALDERIAGLERGIAESRARLAGLESAVAADEEAERVLESRVPELRAERDEAAALRERRASEREVLLGLEAAGEGVEGGPRALRDERSGEVVGLLLDLLEVRPEDAEIVEAALGASAQTVLTEDPGAVRGLVEFLRDRGAGSAAVSGPGRFPEAALPEIADPACGGPLSERVGCDERWRPLVRWLLGRFLRADDADAAFRLAREAAPADLWFCAPGPLMVHASGLARGGSGAGASGGILARRSRLAELEAECAGAESRLAAAESALSGAEEERIRLRESLRARREELAALRDALAADEQALAGDRGRAETFGERRQALEELVCGARDSIAPLRESLAEARRARGGIAAEHEAFQAELARAKERCAELSTARDAADEDFTSATTAVHSARGNLAIYNQKLGGIEERVVAANERAERLRARQRDEEGLLAEARANKETLGEEIQGLYGGLDAEKEKLAVVQERYEARAEETREAQTALLNTERRIAELERSGAADAAEYSRVDVQLGTIVEQTFNDYEVDLREADLSQWPEPDDIETAKAELADMKQRLKALGPVGVDMEDFEEEKRKLADTQRDFDDLDRSRVSLQLTMDRLDRIARENFRSTFEQIRRNFQDIFTGLMAGGEAHLSLEGEDELEAAIEIKARPTGKKMNSVDALSNGEKALTAIALLFAIYLVKPSPFCVLDECDAPFDDANKARFVELLRRFSRQTQFIVITHQKPTMAASDRLYGVTQEVKGISQVVSVQLNEAAALATP